MDAALRQFVRTRADNRCEYCRLPQHAVDGVLQIEHIMARQHGGGDEPENLALACDQCNLHKGPNLSAVDPDSSQVVQLFDPRRQIWIDHFYCRGAEIAGRTAVGRATARLLNMNSRFRVKLRAVLMAIGEW
ncbi:MAG TPA: HNH endonuclease signature motif containing protein [Pirellulaceae bacterium]|jgi:hypothetical protein